MKPKGNPKSGASNEGLGSGTHFSITEKASHPTPKSYPGNGKPQGGGKQG